MESRARAASITPQAASQTVPFRPGSGMLNQRKYLFIRRMPSTIELPLVDDAQDPIVSNMVVQVLAAASTSTTWQIQNVHAKCDFVTLDSGLNESYIKLLE